MKRTEKQTNEQLEAQLREKDIKIRLLEDQVANYQMKLEEIRKAEESIPKDCKPGEYCKACIFSESYFFRSRRGDLEKVHFCAKLRSCQNFVQREVDKQ